MRHEGSSKTQEREKKLRRANAIDSRVSVVRRVSIQRSGYKERKGPFARIVPYLRVWEPRKREREADAKRRKKGKEKKREQERKEGGEKSTTAVSYEHLRWRKVARLENPLPASAAGPRVHREA